MRSYTIALTAINNPTTGALLNIGFARGISVNNDQLVPDAIEALKELNLAGGELVLLNGPASLPVACALAHGLGHVYGAIGCFDPKMAAYVICIAHGGRFSVGDVIPASSVS